MLTVEVNVVTKKEGKAGVKIWVVEAGGQVARENTHKVTLVLKPLDKIITPAD